MFGFRSGDLNVVMVPDYRGGNPYLGLLIAAIESRGWKVTVANYPSRYLALTRLLLTHRNPSILHIHWITGLIAAVAWSTRPWVFRLKLFLLILDIRLVQLLGIKVVWTIHNRLAHEGFDVGREKRIRAALFATVDGIITHGRNAEMAVSELYGKPIDARCSIVPHGNYSGCYPPPSADPVILREKLDLDAQTVVIFSFGMICPYKGLERIIKAVKQSSAPVCLLVAGQAQDKAYAAQLAELANGDERIRLSFGFLSDQALADRLSVADVVACPFTATLTSGSVLLAMTTGKALLLPRAAEILDCLDPRGVIFFNDDKELLDSVSRLDRGQLAAIGDQNRERAATFNWEKVGQLTEAAYERALSR
ncbi:hypothetical protein U5801_14280 [Lamprobacter modestohalophilus]|uniref:glycosyltransferase n=1 Tax=Lamprobacter modestohalophilus TaxID=1064514 RepID=UPI002ADEEA47|nr:glycosyltransferase [Lamprobacter modestohalophilus]MEA1050967.1 hypothetical protein [Lamprobacter modestohalophilus]